MGDIERIDSEIGRRPLHGVAATRRFEAESLAAMPPFTMMARAGDAVARLALALVPHAQRIVVFAGPGNNGGDGIEAARRLQEFGKAVSVVLVGDVARLPADAANAMRRAATAGIAFVPWAESIDATEDTPELVVDALLGFATSRAPDRAIAAAIDRIGAMAARGARVLAVDVPSGLDAERGHALGPHCVVAADTLSLLTLKPGLFTADGRDHAGRVWLADLVNGGADRIGPADLADAWLSGRRDPACGVAPRRHAAHKGSYGDVAVVGGATGMTGAAWLAARAAHAAGAGRVFVDLLAADATATDPTRPELMTRPGWWHGGADGFAHAVVVCGCGGGDAVRDVLPRLLAMSSRLVLDADALNAVAVDTSLQTQLAARAGRGFATVLTPHPLEAARLLGSDVAAVQGDRLTAAGRLADRFGAVVVLKGSGSVIAATGERPRICATGNAALATAGSGDVLAGWLGGRWVSSADDAFTVATRAVVEHGAGAEPERPGAVRAADLVEVLHRRSRA